MRLSTLILAAPLALMACSTGTSPAFVVETAVDAANVAATNYLGLPLCGGTQTLCRDPVAVPKIVAGVQALNADWAAYKAGTVTLDAVSADVTAITVLTKGS